MTIASTARKAGPFAGNGTATSFPFTFKVFSADDIQVAVADDAGVETVLTLGTHYTVTLNSNQETSPGGTITYPVTGAPLLSGSTLAVIGDVDYDQPLDLPSGGNYSPQALENQLDRIAMQVQQLKEIVGRSLQLSVNSPSGTSTALPPPEANTIVAWNAAADGLQNIDPVTLATVVAFGTAVPDIFTGTGAQTAFTLSANPGALGNLDVAVGGATQLPDVDYFWTSGTSISFAEAPADGVPILVRYIQALPQGTTDSATTGYLPEGTGAVSRNVQSVLRETVSVCDFGVVMDSTADQSALMQTAIDYCCNTPTGAGSARTLTAPPGNIVAGDLLIKRQGFRFVGAGRYNTSITAAPGATFVFGTNNQASTTGINELTLESFGIRFINNLDDSVGSAGIKLRYGFGHILRDIHIMRSPGTGAHAAVGLLIQDGVYTTIIEKCSLDRERIESATSNRATTIVHIDGDAEQVDLDNVASIRYFGTTVQGYESTSAPVGRFKATDSDSITFSAGYMETDRTNDDLFQLSNCTDVTIRDNDFRGFNQAQLNTYLALVGVDGLVSEGNSFLRGSNANWNYITRSGTNRRLRLMDRSAANTSVDESEISGRLVVNQENPLIDTSTLSATVSGVFMTRGFNAVGIIGANNATCFLTFGDQDDTDVGGLAYNHVTNALSVSVNNAVRLEVDSGGTLKLNTPTTTTSATGGAATALPAAPQGYLSVDIGGTVRKIPYYA